MRKFFLNKKKILFGLFIFLFVISIILINTIPAIGNNLSRLAIFSTKIKLNKNVDIVNCFKMINCNFSETDYENSKEEEKSIVVNKKKEETNKKNIEAVEGKCEILRKQYKPLNNPKTINIQGNAFVKNMTSLPNSVVLQANSEKPYFKLQKTNEPQVLIYHTHTTECYEKEEKDKFNPQTPTRSKDFRLNVVGVGEEIVKQLQVKGIKAVHVKTIYDDPAYSGAYDRTNAMIVEQLKKHPKIKVVLDIHRDSIVNDKKQRVAPVVEINGKKTAQIMIISGCDNGTNHYKSYKKNLAFACALQKQLEKDYKNITRPVSFKYKHYNQSLSPGALLIEIGSQANSKEEAHNAGMFFGSSLSNLLLKTQT